MFGSHGAEQFDSHFQQVFLPHIFTGFDAIIEPGVGLAQTSLDGGGRKGNRSLIKFVEDFPMMLSERPPGLYRLRSKMWQYL